MDDSEVHDLMWADGEYDLDINVSGRLTRLYHCKNSKGLKGKCAVYCKIPKGTKVNFKKRSMFCKNIQITDIQFVERFDGYEEDDILEYQFPVFTRLLYPIIYPPFELCNSDYSSCNSSSDMTAANNTQFEVT